MKPRVFALVILGLVSSACGATLDTFEFEEDAGTQPVVPGPDLGATVSVFFRPVDILVFVDSSASMADEQESLALNFERFVSQVADVVDYRLGVVSMDLNETGLKEGVQQTTFASEFPNRLESLNLAECVPSERLPGCIIDGAGGIVDSSNMSRGAQIELFRNTVRVGTCGSGVESGLGAMKLALQNLGEGCNAPFVLRPEANLVLIFVTDEDEQEEPSVQSAVAAVLAVKEPARVRVAVVAGVVAGSPSNCSVSQRGQCGRSVCELEVLGSQTSCGGGGLSCPVGETCGFRQGQCVHPDFQYFEMCHWCSYYNSADCCSALAANRYVEFARAMEFETTNANPRIPVSDCVGLGTHVACLAESICQVSFGDTLARIAQELVIEEMEP